MISRQEALRHLYYRALNETDPQQKGQLLELFVKYLLQYIPCKVDIKKIPRERGGDIDLFVEFIEDPLNCNLAFIDRNRPMLIVEVKNWKKKVDENTIRSLRTKLENHNIKNAIVVSPSGFTANAEREAARAVADGIIILLIDDNIINKILNSEYSIDKALSEAHRLLRKKI